MGAVRQRRARAPNAGVGDAGSAGRVLRPCAESAVRGVALLAYDVVWWGVRSAKKFGRDGLTKVT